MLDVSALEERVLKEIVEKGLMRSGETVLAAVSGGSDSMALLALLLALRERLGICLEAAHFEHGIRAERSRQDMRFVCEVCARWGVVCHTGTGDVPQLARTWKCSLEDAARRARYAFLDETALRCGATKIGAGPPNGGPGGDAAAAFDARLRTGRACGHAPAARQPCAPVAGRAPAGATPIFDRAGDPLA